MNDSLTKPRLCRIVTVPLTFATLLRDQISLIHTSGISLTIVSSPGHELDAIEKSTGIQCVAIPFSRAPAPLKDLVSLSRLIKHFLNNRYDIIHSSTPKAGLLTAIAALICRVPIRMHTFTGQVWADRKGLSRWFLKLFDTIIAKSATHLYADSNSQRIFLVSCKVSSSHKISVIGQGSISGVNLARYSLATKAVFRDKIREHLSIPVAACTIVFVGRIRRDKGIVELVNAFIRVSAQRKGVYLLLVGPSEETFNPFPSEHMHILANNPFIRSVGYTPNPEQYLAASDVFCIPSYREGFGSVAIEAGAMGLPVVASRVVGLLDAVADGSTGILVPPKDTDALASALLRLIDSPRLRKELGIAARRRAELYFNSDLINKLVVDEYFNLLRSNSL